MIFQRGLQVKLQEHFRRVHMSNPGSFGAEIRYLVDLIKETPILQTEMEAVERSEPEFDPEEWAKQAVHYGQHGITPPKTAAQRLKFCWHTICGWQDDDSWQRAALMYMASGMRGDVSNRLSDAATDFVEPVVDHLIGRLGEASDVLYLMERYRRRTAWFTCQELFDRYKRDTAKGEDVYDSDLRRFLFEEGIDNPYPKVRTASGEADLVARLDEGDDPLVCEVKLFDGDQRGLAWLGRGLHQAIKYAHDFGKRVAYLVIFNLSDKILRLPSDGASGEQPPWIEEGGVTVFLIEVYTLPQPSASQRGRAQAYEIKREQLVTDVPPDS